MVDKNVLKEEAKEKLQTAKDTLKKTEDDVMKKTEKAVKATAKTVKKSVKTTSKKVAAKVMKEPIIEAFVQYGPREFSMDQIYDQVIEAYKKDGHKKEEIKNMQIYVKPEDDAVYYVINHTTAGKVTL